MKDSSIFCNISEKYVIYFSLLFISACTFTSTSSKKQSFLIAEDDFLLRRGAKITVLNDSIIVFVANEEQVVFYKTLNKGRCERVLNIHNLANYDSIYHLVAQVNDTVSLQQLADSINNGRVVTTKMATVHKVNDSIILFYNTLFTPEQGEYEGRKAILIKSTPLFVRYDFVANDLKIFLIKNNEQSLNAYPNYSLSHFFNDTLLVSTLHPDSTVYRSQIFCYIVDTLYNNLKLVDVKYYPDVPKQFYINSKLPIAYACKADNDLFISAYDKIFSYRKKVVLLSDIFQKYNQREYILNITKSDTTWIYLTFLKDSTQQVKFYLNKFDIKNKKHIKREITYKNEIFGFCFYKKKLYYFERENEQYFLVIYPFDLLFS